MSARRTSTLLGRRQFLRAAGLSLIALPWLPASKSRAALPALRVGVLLPAQTVYPHLGEKLLAGLRLGLGQAGRPVELVTAAFGGDLGPAYAASQRLLAAGGVELVVAALSAEQAEGLAHLYAEKQIPLVAAHVGANAPVAAGRSPYLYECSLDLWRAAWGLGAWAATGLGKRAVVAASLYDAGYDALYAFQHGYEQAGGQVLATRITHQPRADRGLSALLAEIEALRPDFVYASYCGAAAVEFVRAYAASTVSRIPLAGSAFLLEGEALAALGRAAAGIRTVQLAASQGDSDPLARLGSEAARLALQIATGAAAGARTRGLAGPGRARADAPALCLRQARATGRTAQHVPVAPLSLPADLDARFAAARSGPHTGWLNAYLT